jgi:uncharacterized protein (TIGR00369 family)
MIAGDVVAPPIHYLTGMEPTAAGPGTAEFQMPATRWLTSPSGFILSGALAVLADGPLGCALQTELGPSTGYTTAELSMSYLRPPIADGRTLTARGRAVHVGRSLGLTEVMVTDADGRDLAHGTSRCYIFPHPGGTDTAPTPVAGAQDGPPPFERAAEGEATPAEVWLEYSGLEVLRRLIDGSQPAPPITHLTGLRPIAAEEGSCTFLMPASGWLPSPSGLLEGGTLVMLADAAMASAVQTTIPAATAFAPVDNTVKFLRPVPPDGRDLTATAKVVHRGRTIAVAEAQIRNADDKLVCTAISSIMILPGRRDVTAPVVPAEQAEP